MRRALAPALLAFAATTAVCRGVGAWLSRWRELARSGRLRLVADEQRAARVEHALRVHGLSVVDLEPTHTWTSTVVGDDVDDLGLLARAMHHGLVTYVDERDAQAPVETPGVLDAPGADEVIVAVAVAPPPVMVSAPAPAPTRQTEFPAELFEFEPLPEAPVPIVATCLAALAAALAVPALVRPLEDWAPWLICVAVVAAIVSWFLARRAYDS